MINAVDGFKGPSNKDKYSHNFLYVGFLDNVTANAKTKQGWKVDDTDITFKNCDKNPNSYYAYYPTIDYSSKPYGLGSNYAAGNKWRGIINAKDPVEEVSLHILTTMRMYYTLQDCLSVCYFPPLGQCGKMGNTFRSHIRVHGLDSGLDFQVETWLFFANVWCSMIHNKKDALF